MACMDRLFAWLYPTIIKGSEDKWLRDARRDLLAQAKGDVVEIGAGAGHNLDHYPPTLASLTLTEASPYMVAKLKEAVNDKRPDARVVEAPGESLPLEDDSADYVVSTLVLCTAPQDPTLREIRRVLKPAGTLLVLEHVLGTGKVAKWQQRVQPVTRFLARGCEVTRNTRAALEAAGFDTSEISDLWIDDEPKIYAPHIVGSARPLIN